MSFFSRISLISLIVGAGAWLAPAQVFPVAQVFPTQHPAVGSWFGIAVESCATGDTTCPQASLYMTPTIYADGNFIGNDNFSFGGPPFGPHSTAHGQWVPLSGDSILVDYVFMLPGADATTINALRFRWQAFVTSPTTMQGYVNIYFGPPMPVAWQSLTATQFPTIPSQQIVPLTPPTAFYTDPSLCPGGPAAGCPLMFKFSIQRVAPPVATVAP